MKAASCFSGIGAPELGGPQFEWVWCAEVEKFPSAVLAARFPHSVNLGDVTADDFLQRASSFGPLDLLVGGPPCQDFSVAGLRAGVAGDRGNLSLRFMEIAHAIRPRNLLVENVPGWLNMPDNAFGSFLGALVGADAPLLPAEFRNWHWKHEPSFVPGPDGEPAECHSVGGRWQWEYCRWPSAGMVAGPRGRAAWRVFDAQYFGVAQRRRRVFVVADFGDGADPAAVLFERKGSSGNHPPRREAGQGVAPTISARTKGGGGLGTDFDLDGGLAAVCAGDGSGVSATVSSKWSKGSGGPAGDEHYNLVAQGVHCIHSDAIGRDGTALTPSIDAAGASRLRNAGMGISDDVAFNLTIAAPHAVAFALRGREEGAVPEMEGDGSRVGALRAASGGSSRDYIAFDTTQITSKANHSNPQPGDPCHPLAAGEHAPSIAWSIMPQNSGKDFKARAVDVAQPVMAAGPVGGNQGGDYIQQAWQVRRLTPTECERLQGFPDGYCAIEYRGKGAADGPMYKSLGNSWAIPNGAWIIARIAALLERRSLAA